jgi:class 3 adenylate cyclase
VAVCPSCGKENPDGFQFCGFCTAPLTATSPAREQRKTVTIVFCDVVGSTALGESVDPEALRALLARYFERMKAIVESHGGTVDKFIGDAVMAVFGIPQTHEDDALRACRAAVEMRDALPELGIRGRIGVNTGEVVTGTVERLVTGDAVNVAARFEQAAAASEVLIGATTYALVRDAVVAEPVEPLELKGKSGPVAAFRLAAVLDAPERSHLSRFVGRERELALIGEAWERAQDESCCELVTVVGEAGVGKSRLVAEALATIEARVVRGRCLPYGEGITYWPVVEVLKQLAVLPSDPAAAAAIGSLLGESERPTSTDEIAWAFRKLLEEQAPLVCVFDDLQWGEETFLDLIEATAPLSTGAPLLLLCMARPELIERRPTWPVAVRLEPLPPHQADVMIGDGVGAELRERIAQAAGGNPLFISEILAIAADDAEVEVPPTLKALLAMRLDQLSDAERRVLERGSVEGEIFHRGAVQALAPEETQVTTRLAALVRRQLVRPDRAQLAGDDGYRFRHLLIRDVAYDALAKATRADLHRRFAAWLEGHGAGLVELDEILGYHLEQAAHYLAELGRPDARLAAAAAARLAVAGRRARWREDRDAARSLLERAVALSEDPDVHLLVDLGRSIRDPRVSGPLMDSAAERADAAGDAAGAALLRVLAAHARGWLSEGVEEEERLTQHALPLLEKAQDYAGLAELWHLRARGVYNARCQFGPMEDAARKAFRFAQLAGHPQPALVLDYVAYGLVLGPTAVDQALRELDGLSAEHPTALLQLMEAVLLGMSDRIAEGRSAGEATEARLREIAEVAAVDVYMAEIDRFAGDYAAAVERLQSPIEFAVEHGQTALLATVAPLRGLALCRVGRFDEAEPLARQGRELGADDDLMTQMYWRQATALVRAHRAEHEEAESLARGAVEIAMTTDSPVMQGDTLFDLGEVLTAAGHKEKAGSAFRGALDAYERKGIVPLARRTRERLTALQAA